jgi:biotin synthase
MSIDYRNLNHEQLVSWLKEDDPTQLEVLWRAADELRSKEVGQEVHLRGLIEFSNHCMRRCAYCGLRANNKVQRYRMGEDEILSCAKESQSFGYGTVVLQSGEDFGMEPLWLAEVVKRIKAETSLAVTLSVGECAEADYKLWKKAGADRFLLRFETTDTELFERIHGCLPGRMQRIEILRLLKELDYEVGSGVMIGIPGQTYDTLANDLECFKELDLDMIGVGPYIAHPDTPLGQPEHPDFPLAEPGEQVPNSEAMTYKMIALTRLMRPDSNIPSTTALATLNSAEGRELGLARGANIVMPNMTPTKYREFYEIYPDKACIQESAGQCHICMGGRIHSIGRIPGVGPGARPGR